MFRSFVKLDFQTAKPGFSMGQVLFYLALIFAMTIALRSVVQTVWLLMFFMNGFMLLPFSLGEKSNIDVLYVLLNLDRRTVVRGRYFYGIAMLLIITAVSVAAVGAAFLLENAFDINLQAGYARWIIPALGMMQFIFILIELPICFKFSLTKSGIFTSIPHIVLMILVLLFSFRLADGVFVERLTGILNNPAQLWGAVGGAFMVLVVLLYVSYRLSLAFYSRREF